MSEQGGGVKFDQEKLRTDLVPPEAVFALAEVLRYGAKKYEERNWEKGMAWGRAYGAALRHLLSWWKGEDKDPESGISHLHHALTNLAFLVAYSARRAGTDNRVRLPHGERRSGADRRCGVARRTMWRRKGLHPPCGYKPSATERRGVVSAGIGRREIDDRRTAKVDRRRTVGV